MIKLNVRTQTLEVGVNNRSAQKHKHAMKNEGHSKFLN